MLAAKVYGEKDLRVEDIPMLKIEKDTDIIVKVKMVGICGSDNAIYKGTNPFVELPRIMGHEFVGEIFEVGSEVKDFNIGDHVVVEPISYCGKCYACRQHMPNACENLKVLGVHKDGGMQEYVKVPALQLHKIKKDVSWENAVLSEPYTIAGNSTMRANVGLSKTVVIEGAGTIGQLALRVSKAKGAKVLISDIDDGKLEFAKENGADRIVNVSKENLIEAVKDWTQGHMANVVIDAVGAPSTFEDSLKLAGVAGSVVPLGFSTKPVTITQQPIMQKQLTIYGSRHQSFQFEPIIHAIEDGVLQNKGMVNQKFNIKDIQKAFDLMNNHPDKARKIVLTFD